MELSLRRIAEHCRTLLSTSRIAEYFARIAKRCSGLLSCEQANKISVLLLLRKKELQKYSFKGMNCIAGLLEGARRVLKNAGQCNEEL